MQRAPDRLGVRHLIGLISALALYAFLATSAASTKSQTFDESAYIAGGYTYWTLDDYRLHPENGNWTQRWIALPWLFTRPSIPVTGNPSWAAGDAFGVGQQILYAPPD